MYRNRLAKFTQLLLLLLSMQTTVGIAEAEMIELGANSWKPYVTFDANGTASGLAVDKINQISSAMNIPLHIIDRPFKRILSEAKSNKLHGVLLSANRIERRQYLAFSKSIFCERRFLFSRKGNEFDWKNVAELRGKTIGMGIGYYKGKIIQSWIDDGIIVEAYEAQDSSLFQLLLKGRIDFIVYSEKEANSILEANPTMRSQIVALSPALNDVELHIGFTISKNGKEHARKADAAILQLELLEEC